jgi:hypothetical protein
VIPEPTRAGTMPGGSNQQEQPAVAAAAAAAPNALLRQPMPTFSGDGSVTKWIRSFERWATTAGLSADRYPNVLENAFTGDAARWYEVRDTENPDRDWDELKDLLKSRFHTPMTAAETNRMLLSLRQGPNENPRVFADKVEAALRSCRDEITLPRANTDAGRENVQRSADAVFEFFGRMIFVQGLQESVKKEVCNRGVTSWKDCIQAASDAQSYKPSSTGGRSICGIESQDQETEEEPWQKVINHLEALASQRGRGGRGRGAGRGGRGGARGGRGGSRPAWLRDSMLPPGTCFRCGNRGHVRADCVCREENFKWEEIARQVGQPSQEAAAIQQEQQQNQLALPAPKEDVSTISAQQGAAGGFRFADF